MSTALKSNYVGKGRYGYGGGTVDHGTHLGWWERNNIPQSFTDSTITLTSKYAKRPDLLAYELYGVSGLMWLILQFNNILDPDEEFVEGVSIRVPSKSRVFTEILKKRQPGLSET